VKLLLQLQAQFKVPNILQRQVTPLKEILGLTYTKQLVERQQQI
jgi:hypothetical protein